MRLRGRKGIVNKLIFRYIKCGEIEKTNKMPFLSLYLMSPEKKILRDKMTRC